MSSNFVSPIIHHEDELCPPDNVYSARNSENEEWPLAKPIHHQNDQYRTLEVTEKYEKKFRHEEKLHTDRLGASSNLYRSIPILYRTPYPVNSKLPLVAIFQSVVGRLLLAFNYEAILLGKIVWCLAFIASTPHTGLIIHGCVCKMTYLVLLFKLLTLIMFINNVKMLINKLLYLFEFLRSCEYATNLYDCVLQ